MGSVRSEQKSSEKKELKACNGCKVVKYCNKDCQSVSWASYHRYECKIFAKLYPNILPTSVRAAVRLLLVHKAKRIPDGEWYQFMALKSHVAKFREQGGEKFENLCLMSKAATEYSGTDLGQDTILELFCRLSINSFTLVTPTFDPLGVAVHPLPALINHHCRPNAFVRFPKDGRMEVVPLVQIEKDEEIFISYVDPTEPHYVRSLKLRSQYFFDCKCVICRVRNRGPDQDFLQEHDADRKDELLATENKAIELLQSAKNDTNTSNPILKLRYGLYILHQTKAWRDARYPFPMLRHQLMLTYIDAEQYNLAFVYASIQYFYVDPIIHKKEYHPTRLVHGWVLLRLIEYIMEHREWASQDLDLQQYELGLDFWRKHVIYKLYTASQKVAFRSGTLSQLIWEKYEEIRNRRYWVTQARFVQEATAKERYEHERKKLEKLVEDVEKQEKVAFDTVAQ